MEHAIANYDLERVIEKCLRQSKFFIPTATLLTTAFLLWSLYFLMSIFKTGHYWSFIPAGFLVQSFLIISVHDGSHNSITRTWMDRLIANVCSALLFMPFGELYRKYHLIHHGHTNVELDPISPPVLRQLFTRNRFYYILCECVPLLYTFYLILKHPKKNNSSSQPNAIRLSYGYMGLSLLISITFWILVDPPLYFILLTLIVYNLASVARNWCEHMGTELNKKSNTYWFPLGMGIGHHDLHHQRPNFSWLTLTLGLPFHKKDTNPIKAVGEILFNKSFRFYTKK